MGSYAVRKLIQVPLLLLGMIFVMFVLIHVAPGDPIAVFVGDQPAPPEYIAELRHHLGLDRSLPEQFVDYLGGVVQGDLGYSFYYSQPVLSLIFERLPATLLLMGTGLVSATLLGVALGVVAAARPNGWVDAASSFTTLIAFSLPVFWLGELALLVFALQLGWFPTQGLSDLRAPSEGFGAILDRVKHLILPAAVLGTRYVAIDFRLTRAGVLEVLTHEYILTARAKGLSGPVLLFRHALRNALLPIVTITGLNVGFALSGAVLTEVVFGWPGIGRLTLDAISHRDYPVLMGIFIVVTTAVVLVNLVTDLVYGLVDPRIRTR